MKKINFGMIGLGTISHRFVKGLRSVEEANLIAVCSRSLEKAQAYAKEYSIKHSYDCYEIMLNNPAIDAIYIATPNDTHMELMMKAIAHGKHVLCEKPFTVHVEETKEVFAYAKKHHLIVMEAMKACFLPTTGMVKKWINAKEIGKVLYMEAGYVSKSEGVPTTHHLFSKQRGGGSFYDVGIYPLAFLNYIHDKPIKSYVSQSSYQDEIDTFTHVLLQYEDGAVASIRSGIQFDMENEAKIYGELGTIRIPQFWKNECAYLETANKSEKFEELHNKTEFQYQIQHFIQLIQNNKIESDIMSEEETIRNMSILEGVIFK